MQTSGYYKGGAVECEDMIAYITRGIDGEQAFCLGNLIKYVYRAGRKSENPWEDIGKARDYAHRLLKGRWFDE